MHINTAEPWHFKHRFRQNLTISRSYNQIWLKSCYLVNRR